MLYIKNTIGQGVVALAKIPIYFNFQTYPDTFDLLLVWEPNVVALLMLQQWAIPGKKQLKSVDKVNQSAA